MKSLLSAEKEAEFVALRAERQTAMRSRIAARLPRRLQPVVSTDDIVQEVWMAAWRGYATFRPEGAGSLDKWLRVIERQTMADACRRHGAAKRRDRYCGSPISASVDFLDGLASPVSSPSQHSADEDAIGNVAAVIGDLAEPIRTVARLCFIERLARSRIAARMSLSRQTVKLLLARARHKLRHRLAR